MGIPKSPDLVNFVIHLFTAGDPDFWLYEKSLKNELENHFGKIDYISSTLDFQKFTYYYNEEMGKNIKIQAKMLSFENLFNPSFLSEAKLITNEIEEKYAINGKRKVNLDIGYIHHTQFVLASTKHWGNRIYLSKGIYAEITLIYAFGHWESFFYTYENFKDIEYQKELSKIREMYLKKRRKFIK